MKEGKKSWMSCSLSLEAIPNLLFSNNRQRGRRNKGIKTSRSKSWSNKSESTNCVRGGGGFSDAPKQGNKKKD